MNYFTAFPHPVFLLFALAACPRIVSLVLKFTIGLASGGFFWWAGWLLTPHLLIAILALRYWHTNPVLVVIAWIFAVGGTLTEIAGITVTFFEEIFKARDGLSLSQAPAAAAAKSSPSSRS